VRSLSDESGQALIVALAVMLVLTVLVTSALAFTSSNTRDSSHSTAGQKAYAAAESGANNAIAWVQKASSEPTGVPAQPVSLTSHTGSAETDLANGVIVYWGASYNATTKVWTVKSISSIPNPTGATGKVLTRTITQTARITPPPYNFVALNTSCDNHTLLVETSGQLTVTNKMYIDSCNSPNDAFDIFGAGGNISAPDIKVVGGWETHNGSTVTVNGTVCSLSNSSAPITNAQPAGCPTTGQPVLADPLAGKVSPPTLSATPACTSNSQSTGAYAPAVQENGAVTAVATSLPIKFGAGTDPVHVGDVILIDSEQMMVTAAPATASPVTLTVTRGYNSTTAATHADKAAVTKYTAPSHVTATMAAGTYIIAGGGLRVCGSSTLSAPNVMIYNTNDPTQSTGNGALDQIELDTTGSVSLGPQLSGVYQGLTIYQNSSLALDTADSCDSRDNVSVPNQTQINKYDIALISMASSGTNGALGSISGSLYAPANRAVFADEVSGTANLAVLTSCIVINGSNSTFAFDPAGLFGTGWDIGPQSG
jgi:Tfp pilus assembly protein PilX